MEIIDQQKLNIIQDACHKTILEAVEIGLNNKVLRISGMSLLRPKDLIITSYLVKIIGEFTPRIRLN